MRVLLVFVTLSAIPLGFLAWKLEERSRYRRAIDWIEKAGGSVHFHEAEELSWRSIWNEKWVKKGVKTIYLRASTNIDELAPLSELTHLEQLTVTD